MPSALKDVLVCSPLQYHFSTCICCRGWGVTSTRLCLSSCSCELPRVRRSKTKQTQTKIALFILDTLYLPTMKITMLASLLAPATAFVSSPGTRSAATRYATRAFSGSSPLFANPKGMFISLVCSVEVRYKT